MAIKKWETISRKDLLVHSRMHVVEDMVRLPDGNVTTYVRSTPAVAHSVAVIAVNGAGELLLQREYSYPPDEIMWQLPGGAIEKDEDVITAAQRELSEESGYVAEECRIIGFFYSDNRRSDRRQYIVAARGIREELRPADPEEFIESYWLPVDEVERMIPKLTNMNLQAALNLWLHSE